MRAKEEGRQRKGRLLIYAGGMGDCRFFNVFDNPPSENPAFGTIHSCPLGVVFFASLSFFLSLPHSISYVIWLRMSSRFVRPFEELRAAPTAPRLIT